jgi:DinB superfamily
MVNARLPGFRGEYLWEFDIAEQQLLALAEAFPPERYGWRTAETARSVSEILVHVGAGNFALLSILGVEGAPDLYANVEGDTVARIMAMAARNESLEKSVTDKTAVLAFLRGSLDAVRAAFSIAADAELDRQKCSSKSVRRCVASTFEYCATRTSTWDSSSHTPARWACPRHGTMSGKLAGKLLRVN